MGFFSNLFAKQNCAVCGKECGTLHRSKLRDGQFLCDDCGNKCSKYIRLSELTLDEAKEHMEYMARMKRVFDEVFNKTEFRVNAYPSTPSQMGLVICFSKRDRREIGYAHIARQHLDHIFGVHDNETSMFGRRMSKAEERELKGQMGMIGALGAVASAAMKGGQLSEQEKARFVENINLANDAQTGGMALYSRRADEAFAKVQ